MRMNEGKALQVKSIITGTTTQTHGYIQARKGLEATREGGETRSQGRTEGVHQGAILSPWKWREGVVIAEAGVHQSKARFELLLCNPHAYPQFSVSQEWTNAPLWLCGSPTPGWAPTVSGAMPWISLREGLTITRRWPPAKQNMCRPFGKCILFLFRT